MSSEWQEYRLGDVTRWASGGTPSKQNPEYWGGSIPWISASSMKAKICVNSDERITEEAVRSGARMCDPGTILLLVRGSELHKRIPIGVATKRVAFNQDVKAITTCSGDLSGDYLYYLLKGSEEFLLNSVEFTGIGAGKLETQFLQDLVFPLPTREEQSAITDFMIALDDKIELNRKTNETLEAMAKALFKSWFVDFDPVRAKAKGRPTGLPAEISDLFPDSFEDSELGEIPRGWQSCPFTQLVDVISGGTPKTSVDEYWNGSIPWFSVVDAPSGADCWVIQTEKSITHLGLDNCSSKLLPIGTTIISARGTVGKVCLTGQDMAMNQSCYGLRSKAANGEFFCFYLTKSLVEILEARAHGSVFSTITRDTLDGVSTISPPLEVKSSFNSIARALLGKIKNNLEESRILGNQRDTLLPKLISGEIRIPDAEKMLEEVGV
jgi:type I restriction enzyme S subunit